jgi:alpha-tubulin suppressor-like RCC1 family protein
VEIAQFTVASAPQAVHAGATFCMALSVKNEVFSWGDGKAGQVGRPMFSRTGTPALRMERRADRLRRTMLGDAEKTFCVVLPCVFVV